MRGMDFFIATNLRIRHKVENNRIMRGWGLYLPCTSKRDSNGTYNTRVKSSSYRDSKRYVIFVESYPRII